MPVKVDVSKCIGCGACEGVCPTGSLSLNADGKCENNPESCLDCGACIASCPQEALSEE